MNNERKVKGCYSCPLAFRRTDGLWVCGHPDNKITMKCPINRHEILDDAPAAECPLKMQDLTISLNV